MPDASVAITAGSGTNIDTRTEASNGNHRQVVVIGDPSTNSGIAPVDGTTGLKVNLGSDNDVTVSGTVDLGATDNGVLDAIASSVAIMDDWDESNRAKINPIVGQAGVAAGAGTVGVTVPRVTLASNDPAVAKLGTIDTDTGIIAGAVASGQMQVDIVADGAGLATTSKQDDIIADTGAIQTAVELIDDTVSTIDDTPVSKGISPAYRAQDFDFGSFPTTVDSEGDAVIPAASLSGVQYVMLVAEDGGNIGTVIIKGDKAHDSPDSGEPVKIGGYAKAAAPSDVSADADRVNAWFLRNGSLAVNLTAAGALLPGDASNGLTVNLGGNNDVTVSGVATEAKQDDIITDTGAIQTAVEKLDDITGAIKGPGEPSIDSVTQFAINLNAGANQVLVSSSANKQIWVYAVAYTVSVDGTVSFQDEDDLAITGIMDHAANSGMAIGPSGNFSMPLWKLATNKDLEVDIVTAAIDGWITYAIVSV